MTEGSVIVAGAGPGLGAAIARRFAAAGFAVAMLAREASRLSELAAADARLNAIPCDMTLASEVEAAVARCEEMFGPLACAVFNAGAFSPGSVLEIEPAEFERCWKVGAYGGFLLAQAAGRRMVARAAGTLLFTGATASLRGGARFANLAAPKFALRALAQSLARELGPRGIHVAHVIIDGQIRSPRSAAVLAERGPDSVLEPAAIAEAYLQLHRQPRSAWTLEMDLRPWVERF